MSDQDREQEDAREVGERSEPDSRASGQLPPAGTSGKAYTPEQKAAALRAFARSGQGMRAWCETRGISTATLCAWRRAFAASGLEGLSAATRRSSAGGSVRTRHYTPDERRAALAAYRKSGLTQEAFCRLWGVSATSLQRWLRAYRASGPKGLERPWGAGRRGPKKKPVPEAVRSRVVEAKTRFPSWGLRRIAAGLRRIWGLRVGVHQVRRVAAEEGLPSAARKKKRRRSADRVRRFERARAGELWQSDITSYVLKGMSVEPTDPDSDPKELKKKVAQLEKELAVAQQLIDLLKTLPSNAGRQLTRSAPSKPSKTGKRASRRAPAPGRSKAGRGGARGKGARTSAPPPGGKTGGGASSTGRSKARRGSDDRAAAGGGRADDPALEAQRGAADDAQGPPAPGA